MAEILLKMAVVYAMFELTDEAKRIGYCALDILKPRLDPKDQRMGECWFMLGNVHYLCKEYHFADEHYKFALEINLHHHEHKLATLKTLNGLGLCNMVMGWPTKAAQCFQ